MIPDPVFHTGTITALSKTKAQVKLHSTPLSECGTCALAFTCGKDKADSIVEARIASGVAASPGAKVTVAAAPLARTKASLLLLVLPAMAFIAGIIMAIFFGANEATALAAGTAASALCFLIVYLTDSPARTVWTITEICEG